MTVTYALYSDPDAAQGAFDALRAAEPPPAVDERQIAVISSEPFDGYDFFTRQHRTLMPWVAAAAGIGGGILGFLFAAYTQAVYPIPTGGMAIVPLYADGVITYELTMLSAILATLITLLVTARLPNRRRRLYDPEISDGKILIGVLDPPEDSRSAIEAKLRAAGAESVRLFS